MRGHRFEAALAAFLMALAAACAGITARDEALLPTLRDAWPHVSAEVALGAASAPPEQRTAITAQQEAADQAFAAADKVRIRSVQWPVLQSAAAAGVAGEVASGRVSPGVAESLTERQRVFFAGVTKYLER